MITSPILLFPSLPSLLSLFFLQWGLPYGVEDPGRSFGKDHSKEGAWGSLCKEKAMEESNHKVKVSRGD